MNYKYDKNYSKMVKNTTGGGRTKGLARKHQRATNFGNTFLRVPEC